MSGHWCIIFNQSLVNQVLGNLKALEHDSIEQVEKVSAVRASPNDQTLAEQTGWSNSALVVVVHVGSKCGQHSTANGGVLGHAIVARLDELPNSGRAVVGAARQSSEV